MSGQASKTEAKTQSVRAYVRREPRHIREQRERERSKLLDLRIFILERDIALVAQMNVEADFAREMRGGV